jgi:hypothetical protein
MLHIISVPDDVGQILNLQYLIRIGLSHFSQFGFLLNLNWLSGVRHDTY